MGIIEGARERPYENAGVPTDGTGGTFAGIAKKGSLLIDTTTPGLYQNSNTQASPTWAQINAGGVTYGVVGQMAAAGTGIANDAGVVAAASRIDHVHALGAHDHSDSTKGGQIGTTAFAANIFTADATGRAPFQDGIWTTAKLATGILSADASGRALMASNFFDATTVEAVFGDSTIPSDKVNWAFGGTPTTIQPDASGSAGTAITPSRSDHVHGAVAESPIDGSLSAANAEGTSTSFSRADHAHRAVLLDGIELEFGTGYDAVMGWQTGDASNHTLVIGLADANQALHITDKSAIGTDWNVGADTHPSLYIHSNTTPSTDFLKMFHDATDAWVRSFGGTLKLAAPDASTVQLCMNEACEYSFSQTAMDMLGNHIDNAGYLILNNVTKPAGTEVYIANDNTGDLNLNALTGKTVNIEIAGTDVFTFSATALTLNNNAIIGGTGYIQFGTTPAGTGNLRFPNAAIIWYARNQANDADIPGWKLNNVDNYEAAVDVQMNDKWIYGSYQANGDLTLSATSDTTVTTSYVISQHMFNSSIDGISTKVVAGAVGDGSFSANALNGLLAIDSTNGRIYFRYNAAWHYVAQTAGVQIPKEEIRGLKIGDQVVALIDKKLPDGALHARWVKMKN